MNIKDDLIHLIKNVPIFLQDKIKQHSLKNEIREIILDLGRKPEVRFFSGSEYLSQKIISWQDLEYSTKQIGAFSNDNRAGIEKTLHRISCIRNRRFLINGLTYRIGRSVVGTVSIMKDVLYYKKSILILGKPGVGKTTVIREIARVLADELEKRVIIIDTSNEIGGDSNIPHVGVGHARRMQVAKTKLQHEVMMEAVENHMPQIIIIDEIGTELEVLAARCIAEKGVQLVGTTHGNCLENLIKNPPLANLIGGIQYVILSDEESRRRQTQKSILERKGFPTFEIIIELQHQLFWVIHENVQSSVDFLLVNTIQLVQTRTQLSNVVINVKCQRFFSIDSRNFSAKDKTSLLEITSVPNNYWINLNQHSYYKRNQKISNQLLIYVYSLPTNLLREILSTLKIHFAFTSDITKAQLILGLKKQLRVNLKLKMFAERENIPIYSVNKISIYQIAKLINLIYL